MASGFLLRVPLSGLNNRFRKSQYSLPASWINIGGSQHGLPCPDDSPGGCMSALSASRRDFLKITGAGMAGSAMASATPGYSRIIGANDRMRVAVCGVRGRGHEHIRGFSRVPNTELAAL